MTQMDAIHDDLRFLRRMAEQGGKAPILGTTVLIALTTACGIYGFAAVGFFLLVAGWKLGMLSREASLSASGALWATSHAGGLLTLLWLLFRLATRGRGERRHPVVAAALRAVLFAFLAIFGGFLLLGMVSDQGASAYSLMPTIVLALYGAGWSMAGAVTGRLWMKAVAGGAMLAAVASAVAMGISVGSVWWLLDVGVSLLLLGFLPGLQLLRQARAAA